MTHELDNLRGGILVTDVEGRILYANKRISSKKHKPTHSPGIHIAPIMNQNGEVEFFIELQPDHLNPNEESRFNYEFEAIIQNQQRHPEAFLKFIQTWMGAQSLEIPEHFCSPVHLLEALLKEHAEINLDEDVNWIELAKKDSLYFRELYEKYQHKVFNYFLYRVGKNFSIAEDLTQETFIRAFNALPQFDYRNIRYLSYLLMIAHNLLANYYREVKPIFLDDMSKLPVYTASTAQSSAEIRLAWEAVHQLAPIEQAVLTMKYDKDFSIKKIAEKLKKSVNAIKLHLSRARKKLRSRYL